VKNASTIRNNRGMIERVEENHFVSAFSIVLTITAVTLITSRGTIMLELRQAIRANYHLKTIVLRSYRSSNINVP
jgi:hypothetical protein